MGSDQLVPMVGGKIPSLEQAFFAYIGKQIKQNVGYAQLFNRRFVPNPKQQEFYDMIDHAQIEDVEWQYDMPMHVLAYGTTGSGKSYAVYAYVLRKLLEFPGAQALFLRQKIQELKMSSYKDVRKFLDTYNVPYKKNDTTMDIVLPNGSKILFRSDLALAPSGSDKADSLGSTAFSFVVFEEADAIRSSTAITMAGRMRENVGRFRKVLFYICNPPSKHHWLWTWFMPPNNDPNDPTSRYRAMQFTREDNVKHVGMGYNKAIMEDFQKNKHLAKRLGDGEFGVVPKGTPYFQDTFFRELHVTDLRTEDNEGNKVYRWNRLYPMQRGWDPGFRHTGMVVMQDDPDLRQLRVYVARIRKDCLLEQYLEEILPELNRMFPGALWEDFVDVAARQKSTISERSAYDIMRKAGLQPRCKPSSVTMGLNTINRMLRTLTGGKPAVLLDKEGCEDLIDAFEAGYCNDGNKVDDNGPVPCKDGFYDHIMDAFRYPVVFLYGLTSGLELQQLQQPNGLARQHGQGYSAVSMGQNIWTPQPASSLRNIPAHVVGGNPFRRDY